MDGRGWSCEGRRMFDVSLDAEKVWLDVLAKRGAPPRRRRAPPARSWCGAWWRRPTQKVTGLSLAASQAATMDKPVPAAVGDAVYSHVSAA